MDPNFQYSLKLKVATVIFTKISGKSDSCMYLNTANQIHALNTSHDSLPVVSEYEDFSCFKVPETKNILGKERVSLLFESMPVM